MVYSDLFEGVQGGLASLAHGFRGDFRETRGEVLVYVTFSFDSGLQRTLLPRHWFFSSPLPSDQLVRPEFNCGKFSSLSSAWFPQLSAVPLDALFLCFFSDLFRMIGQPAAAQSTTTNLAPPNEMCQGLCGDPRSYAMERIHPSNRPLCWITSIARGETAESVKIRGHQFSVSRHQPRVPIPTDFPRDENGNSFYPRAHVCPRKALFIFWLFEKLCHRTA